jgi:hypothetical protein
LTLSLELRKLLLLLDALGVVGLLLRQLGQAIGFLLGLEGAFEAFRLRECRAGLRCWREASPSRPTLIRPGSKMGHSWLAFQNFLDLGPILGGTGKQSVIGEHPD